MTGGGVTVDKEYGMTTVDLNNSAFKDEPFVLAADVSSGVLCQRYVYETKERKK